jgi:cytochrome c oxidase assembly protein subunit 15
MCRLSITEWRPVTGSLPPLSAADWQAEFAKYRASPEFQLLNARMTLPEFQRIYYMEWAHRQWGRLVGVSFVLPAVYFVARRRVTARMAARLAAIAGLIGLQGAIGWWMVQSGLRADLFAPGSHPRVSQHRLAAHLGTAFVCYAAMLWNGLAVLRENRLLRLLHQTAATTTITITTATAAAAASPSGAAAATGASTVLADLAALQHPALRRLRLAVRGLAALVLLTALSGALVAGLDAGLVYNDFPYMDAAARRLTPPRHVLFSDEYVRRADGADRWWRNMLENPATVQLDHRILATTTFTAVMALAAYTRFSRRLRAAAAAPQLLPRAVRAGVTGVVHLVCMQVLLGIGTLVYLVPLPLAAAHQAGSLALLSGVIVLASRLSVPRRVGVLVMRLKKRKPLVVGASG